MPLTQIYAEIRNDAIALDSRVIAETAIRKQLDWEEVPNSRIENDSCSSALYKAQVTVIEACRIVSAINQYSIKAV